jgi:hypothetical protein
MGIINSTELEQKKKEKEKSDELIEIEKYILSFVDKEYKYEEKMGHIFKKVKIITNRGFGERLEKDDDFSEHEKVTIITLILETKNISLITSLFQENHVSFRIFFGEIYSIIFPLLFNDKYFNECVYMFKHVYGNTYVCNIDVFFKYVVTYINNNYKNISNMDFFRYMLNFLIETHFKSFIALFDTLSDKEDLNYFIDVLSIKSHKATPPKDIKKNINKFVNMLCRCKKINYIQYALNNLDLCSDELLQIYKSYRDKNIRKIFWCLYNFSDMEFMTDKKEYKSQIPPEYKEETPCNDPPNYNEDNNSKDVDLFSAVKETKTTGGTIVDLNEDNNTADRNDDNETIVRIHQ